MAFVPSPLTVSLTRPLGSTQPVCSSPFLGGAVRARPSARAAFAVGPRATPRCGAGSADFPAALDGSAFRVGIVWTRWNSELVGPMVDAVKGALGETGVLEENVVEMSVPGAFEAPMAARLMCATQKVDAVVVVGVLIKGETDHYEYIAGPVANGLMDLQLTVNVPIVFGVLTCPDRATAEARSIGDKSHAADWGRTAVDMAVLRASQAGGPKTTGRKTVGF